MKTKKEKACCAIARDKSIDIPLLRPFEISDGDCSFIVDGQAISLRRGVKGFRFRVEYCCYSSSILLSYGSDLESAYIAQGQFLCNTHLHTRSVFSFFLQMFHGHLFFPSRVIVGGLKQITSLSFSLFCLLDVEVNLVVIQMGLFSPSFIFSSIISRICLCFRIS